MPAPQVIRFASMDIANALHAKGIVYTFRFYAINAGGLIHVADERGF
ncbi:MAG: hypothetical protein R3A45_02045 [Bdellovibrionota bacterium]